MLWEGTLNSDPDTGQGRLQQRARCSCTCLVKVMVFEFWQKRSVQGKVSVFWRAPLKVDL